MSYYYTKLVIMYFIIISYFIPLSILVSATQTKTCMEVKEDYDLRNSARDNNVMLIVTESDNKEEREKLCKKLELTPDERLKGDTVFAYLEITDGKEDYEGVWQEGNRNFVKNSLGLKSYPSFVYLKSGMDGFSKYSDHITPYTGSTDSLDMSDVEKFIEKKVGFRLGNDVYNIVFFDTLASRFVSYGDATGIDLFKQRLLQGLVRVSTLFSWKEPFRTIGNLYNRAFTMSFEHGVDYAEKQVTKLQKRLENNKNTITADKSHEFQQKIAILKSFSEPKELTAEVRAFLKLILCVSNHIINMSILMSYPGRQTDFYPCYASFWFACCNYFVVHCPK